MKRTMAVACGLAGAVWALALLPEARADAPADGRQIYRQMCAACHGPYGRGDGPVADQLTVRPPDLTRPEVLAGRSDEQVRAALAGGEGASRHTPMVVAQTLKPEAMRAAIAYARTLSVPGKHVSVLAGRDLYRTFCWTCHGKRGDGRGPAAEKLPGPKPRDFTSPEFVVKGRENEIARIISEGAARSFHGSEYMLEWGNKLSPQQVKDLVAYLATFRAAGR